MPPIDETSLHQTIQAVPQRVAIPRLDTRPLPKQSMARQDERQCALQDDIEQKAAWQWGELVNEREANEARLADLHQRESTLEAGQATVIDHAER
jgi:hypothetical protein